MLVTGIVGIHVDSSVLTFDAVYCAVCVLSYMLLAIYNTKIDHVATKEFQYGYHKLEPLLIVTQALLIVFACIYAFMNSLRDIIHTHVIKNCMEVALLEGILGVLCIIICLGCYGGAKRYNSNILKLQAWVWVLDFIQSILIASAFMISRHIQTTKYYWITPYIDPMTTIFVVLTIVRQPMIIFYQSLLDLLDKSISPSTLLDVDNALQAMVLQYGKNFQVDSVITRKAGGQIFIIVMCKKSPNMSLDEVAKIKVSMIAALKNQPFSIDIKLAV